MRRSTATPLAALLTALLALTASAAHAEDFAIGVRAGTAGIGPEVSFEVGPHLDLRVPVGLSTYEDTYDDTGVQYDGELKLRNALLLADIHLSSGRSGSAGGFRLSIGGGWNDNTLEVSAPVSELVRRYRPEIAPFIPASAGTISGEAKGSSFAPYAGLGWGSAGRGGRWGVSFDLGVIYQGSPEVDLTTDLNLGVPLPSAVQALLDVATAAEERELERELEGYRYYPVVALGIVFRP